MKARELFQKLEGIDPEAEVVLNYAGGDEVWSVDSVSIGFVNYAWASTINQENYEEEFGDLHPEFIEGLEKAVIIRAG